MVTLHKAIQSMHQIILQNTCTSMGILYLHPSFIISQKYSFLKHHFATSLHIRKNIFHLAFSSHCRLFRDSSRFQTLIIVLYKTWRILDACVTLVYKSMQAYLGVKRWNLVQYRRTGGSIHQVQIFIIIVICYLFSSTSALAVVIHI